MSSNSSWDNLELFFSFIQSHRCSPFEFTQISFHLFLIVQQEKWFFFPSAEKKSKRIILQLLAVNSFYDHHERAMEWGEDQLATRFQLFFFRLFLISNINIVKSAKISLKSRKFMFFSLRRSFNFLMMATRDEDQLWGGKWGFCVSPKLHVTRRFSGSVKWQFRGLRPSFFCGFAWYLCIWIFFPAGRWKIEVFLSRPPLAMFIFQFHSPLAEWFHRHLWHLFFGYHLDFSRSQVNVLQ